MNRFVFIVFCVCAGSSLAHEVRPAYLEINAHDDNEYSVIWKQPLLNGRPLSLQPEFPRDCVRSSSRIEALGSEALIERIELRCASSLEGRPVEVSGLTKTLTDVLVRAQLGNGTTTILLRPESPSAALITDQSAPLTSYLRLGVEHLLFGIDHVLFVIGLMFFLDRIGPLVKTITAFTVAHSLTLGISAVGLVRIPQAPIEAIIALSILFLAVEKLRGTTDSLLVRRTWVIAFIFGLLHGFGFAGALNDIGLPRENLLFALLLFNLGVELGQLAVVAGALLVARAALHWFSPTPQLVWQAPVYGIGAIASFWFVSRSVSIVFT
ncbi:MAG: HupE/UreJ family protein [Pseudomonadales bacterium]|nr:HupE/UreJ family protein [Pseudomonadales bacterium]